MKVCRWSRLLVTTTLAFLSSIGSCAIAHSSKSNLTKEKLEVAPRAEFTLKFGLEPNPEELSPRLAARRPKPVAKSDSYLEALEHAHTIRQPLTRQDLAAGPVYRGEEANSLSNEPPAHDLPLRDSGALSDSYRFHSQDDFAKISRISYGTASEGPTYLPSSEYSAPQLSYGDEFESQDDKYVYHALEPVSTYGAPVQTWYRPPAYQAPQGSPYLAHGAPHQGLGSLQATYSTSYPMPDIFPLTFFPVDMSWPISLKLKPFTLIKIVLKLIIFKIIVKFIAIICLLIFIPKLIHKKEEHNHDYDESRNFNTQSIYATDGQILLENFSTERLHMLSSTISKSIEFYQNMNESEIKSDTSCTSFACRIKKSIFVSKNIWDDYIRLFKSYVVEEEAVQKRSSQNRKRRR